MYILAEILFMKGDTMAQGRKIKPKKTPVLTGSDLLNVSKRGWVIKEKKNHLQDLAASSPITFSKNRDSIPVAPTLPISSLSTRMQQLVRLPAATSVIAK